MRRFYPQVIQDLLIYTIKDATICLIYSSLTGQLSSENTGIDRFVNDPVLANSNLSISVINTSNGKLVASHRPNKVLVPASSLKLLTTFSALKYLGKDFKFSSTLQYSGEIKSDGTLIGDLYFVGSGDPTLGSDRLNETQSFEEILNDIVRYVKQAGITCIKGQVIIDESVFDSYPVAPSWQWNDLGNYYASGAWGTNINENLCK